VREERSRKRGVAGAMEWREGERDEGREGERAGGREGGREGERG
jgi:hypothetical protein